MTGFVSNTGLDLTVMKMIIMMERHYLYLGETRGWRFLMMMMMVSDTGRRHGWSAA